MPRDRLRPITRAALWMSSGLAVVVAAGVAASLSGGRVRAELWEPPVVVDGIYPTADRLPANLLRMYIVFSHPMSVGESRSRVRLLDAEGREVPGAFLHLEEELWDPSGRRLTMLFDPGRIKRGLRANLEQGPPLVEGQRYRLVVDAEWRDARGRPLRQGMVKTFEAVAPDRKRPDVGAWAVEPPPPETRTPLLLQFDESLDRALLSSAIVVQDAAGESIPGVIEVARQEREWAFTPARPWSPGKHVVRVSPELEDVAGNSLQRLFDMDLATDTPPLATSPACFRTFVVPARRDQS